MSAYLICIVEHVSDPLAIDQYRQEAQKTDPTNIEPVIIYGKKIVMEGPDFDGVAVLKFPDLKTAETWYKSPEYQNALQHRLRGATSRLFLVEGVDIAA